MDRKTAIAIRRLESNMIFFGPLLREKGALALFNTNAPQAVDPLLRAVKDSNEKIRLAAYHTLNSLQGAAIDYFCQLWEENRDRFLETIIRDCNYFASGPKRLRYITCLMHNAINQVVNADSDGVDILISLIKDKDQRLAANSEKALWSLSNPEGIDRLCMLWEKNREQFLEKIIVDCGYIAQRPPALFFKTMYFHGKHPEDCPDDDILTFCLLDSDDRIMKNAVAHFLSFDHEQGCKKLWEIGRQQADSKIAAHLSTFGFFPADTAERALFYFLAGSMEKYHDIDFDQSILRTWYESRDAVWKEFIARRIRQSGDARLLSIFKRVRSDTKKFVSTREVDVQIDILINNKDFERLFDLLSFSNYGQAQRIVTALKEDNWCHPDSRLAQLQSQLETVVMQEQNIKKPASYAIAMYQDFRPMFLGKQQPPSDDLDILKWVEDDKNFRRRSAAIILLAEKGSPDLPDAANEACGDVYWQVRMAAAAAELLRPGTLSPANRTLLADDHVYWVQALLKLPVNGRLSELGLDGLEKLKQKAEFSSFDKKPSEPDDFMTRVRGLISSPERIYLLTLAEYLSTEGEFSEDGYMDAGITDVEVVFED